MTETKKEFMHLAFLIAHFTETAFNAGLLERKIMETGKWGYRITSGRNLAEWEKKIGELFENDPLLDDEFLTAILKNYIKQNN